MNKIYCYKSLVMWNENIVTHYDDNNLTHSYKRIFFLFSLGLTILTRCEIIMTNFLESIFNELKSFIKIKN